MVWLCDATAAVDGVLTATDGALHPGGGGGALPGVCSPAGVVHPGTAGVVNPGTAGILHPGDDGALQGVFSPAGVLHPGGCGALWVVSRLAGVVNPGATGVVNPGTAGVVNPGTAEVTDCVGTRALEGVAGGERTVGVTVLAELLSSSSRLLSTLSIT